jgi:hypothetical protein
LYETSDGAFFLVRKIKEGCYAEPDFIGRLPYLNDPGLYPLTRKQALAWAESKKFDTDKIEAMFGKIDEVGKKTAGSMPLRIPKPLKASIDAAAEDAEQSANAWAMRCLERCANMDGIGEKLGEIWQTARSGHRERRGRLLERDAARDALTH